MVNRVQIFRNDRARGGRYSKGKYAVGICHRSGFKVPYKELKFEPGTNYLVHKSENDGEYSEVMHPQNYSPEDRIERIALKWSFADVALSLGSITSAEQLGLPSYASVSGQFIDYASIVDLTCIGTNVSAGSSVATGVSGYNTNFSIARNSQYYLIIFQGI